MAVAATDFESPLELKPTRKNFGGADLCHAGAVSLFTTREDAEAMRKAVKPLSQHLIAFGSLKNDDGVVEPTPLENFQSHHDYWPTETAEPWERFKV